MGSESKIGEVERKKSKAWGHPCRETDIHEVSVQKGGNTSHNGNSSK